LIKKIRKNHLLRALRCDKIQLSILSAVLKKYLKTSDLNSENMTLHLFNRDHKILTTLAEKIIAGAEINSTLQAEIVQARGKVGSGAYPVAHIDSVAVKLSSARFSADKLARKLRLNSIPIFGYIENDIFYLNMLALSENDVPDIVSAFQNLS
jgi:L-seryl-tRNA(Ser) seleniumtransferase